jgi:GNAT superfamily N-acetyltransferase
MFDIKQATIDDMPLILAFIRELADYEHLSHEVVATEKSLRDAHFGARPAAEVIIGYHEGEAIGFALFFHNFSTFLGMPGIYLEDLYVRSLSRGKGMGSALLKYLARLARERKCGRLEWAVLDWNEPAIKFYENIGAEPMNEWTTFRLTGSALARLSES